MAVLAAPVKGERIRSRSRRRSRVKVIPLAALVAGVLYVPACLGIRIAGCMKEEQISVQKTALAASVERLERGNPLLAAKLAGLSVPDRLSKIAEGTGMMREVPSASVSCPPSPRMAQAADTPFAIEELR